MPDLAQVEKTGDKKWTREQLNGIQHGIPTNDIEMTIAFYEKLDLKLHSAP